MANVNRVFLMGRLTRDPELRYTPKGTALTELDLAINRTFSDDSGRQREEVTYLEVTLWGRLAEVAQQYLKKGSPTFIEGRLHLDTWEDRQSGHKRSRLRVVGENLQLLANKEHAGSPPSPQPAPSRVPQASTSASPRRPGLPEPDLDVEPF